MITITQAEFLAIRLILHKKYKITLRYNEIPDHPGTKITLTEGNIMNIRQGKRMIYQKWSGASLAFIEYIATQLQD